MPSAADTARAGATAPNFQLRRHGLRSAGLIVGLAATARWAPSSLAMAPALASTGAAELAHWPGLALKGLQGHAITVGPGPWKATLVDFWASGCTPCRLSFPWMNRLHKRLGNRGLRILAINLDRRSEDAIRFLSAYPARFEIALDPAAQAAAALQIQAMPTSMLVRRDGAIGWTHKGFRESDVAVLEQRIEEALG